MKRLLLPAILLIATCLNACGVSADSPTADSTSGEVTTEKAAPTAWFDSDRNVHDFGDVYSSAVRETTFDLVSAGTEDLTICELNRSCGCTQGELFVLDETETETPIQLNQAYAPGTRFRLHASLNSRGRYGKQRQTVMIKTGGNKLPTVFTIEAEIVQFLELDPPALEIKGATTLEGFEGELTVKSRGEEFFVLEVRRDIIPEGLEIQLEPIEPDSDGRAKSWNLGFDAAPGIRKGPYKQKLVLTTDVANLEAELLPNGESPFHRGEVWLRTEVKGVFDVRPERLTFGRMIPGQRQSKKIIIRSRDPEFLMENIEVALFNREGDDLFEHREHFNVVANAIDNGRAWEIELQVGDLPFEGGFTGIVAIKSMHKFETQLGIPFTGKAPSLAN